LSLEASNLTSPLDEAVSKVEPEFEGLQKQEELSSSQDDVSDALLIRYIKFISFVIMKLLYYFCINIFGHNRHKICERYHI
jgi:hypothetical protein